MFSSPAGTGLGGCSVPAESRSQFPLCNLLRPLLAKWLFFFEKDTLRLGCVFRFLPEPLIVRNACDNIDRRSWPEGRGTTHQWGTKQADFVWDGRLLCGAQNNRQTSFLFLHNASAIKNSTYYKIKSFDVLLSWQKQNREMFVLAHCGCCNFWSVNNCSDPPTLSRLTAWSWCVWHSKTALTMYEKESTNDPRTWGWRPVELTKAKQGGVCVSSLWLL